MTTLHIEHAITDLATWVGAFNKFQEARRSAGVTAQRIHQPIDDDQYIVVGLDFDSLDAAKKFKEFLEQVVWQNPDMSPGLEGTPRARLLTEVEGI